MNWQFKELYSSKTNMKRLSPKIYISFVQVGFAATLGLPMCANKKYIAHVGPIGKALREGVSSKRHELWRKIGK